MFLFEIFENDCTILNINGKLRKKTKFGRFLLIYSLGYSGAAASNSGSDGKTLSENSRDSSFCRTERFEMKALFSI